MMTSQALPGFYGKFPILGDFVSRRLPADFIRVWDSWLQVSLTASREALGANWLDIYLTSPIWRFILSPGNCGPTGWMGVLMPSVDRVGRYFPLTLATAIGKENNLAGLFVSAAGWFERLEHLALSGLEDGFDLDAFDGHLQKEALPPLLNSDSALTPGMDNAEVAPGPLAMHVAMEGLDALPGALAHLGSSLLSRLLSAYSLWTTSGSERVHPCLLAYQGLPPAAAFTELISGAWRYTVRQGGAEGSPPPPGSPPPGETAGKVADEGSPLPCNWRWHSCATTSVGKVRSINEDAYLDHPEDGIWAVADGMGGHWAGEVASKTVVDALGALSAGRDLQTSLSGVTASLQVVNDRLITLAEEEGGGRSMGSTVVVLLACGDKGAAAWVGDSRLYRLRGDDLTQLTEDHSLVAELARQGEPTVFGELGAVNSNVITRAVGAQPELLVDTLPIQVEAGDVYLLCSDGLVREVQDQEICNILRWHEHGECAKVLIDLALERGAKDNVTVVVAWPEGG